MQYESRSAFWRTSFLVFVVGCGCVSAVKITSNARGKEAPTPQQDIIRVESRITQLEQRLYTIENNVRNLDQQLRIAGASSRGVSADDLALLRSEIQLLERRLTEDECGLAKLDERTLSPNMRSARRSSSRTTDPCRINFEAPLQPPGRH